MNTMTVGGRRLPAILAQLGDDLAVQMRDATEAEHAAGKAEREAQQATSASMRAHQRKTELADRVTVTRSAFNILCQREGWSPDAVLRMVLDDRATPRAEVAS